MQVKRITSMIFLLFLFFTVPVAANLPARPASDIYVQDNADLLSKDTKQQILSIGHELDQKTTAQIVVVTVKNLDDQSIEEYAHQLFRQWGIGSKDKNNGILLLISFRMIDVEAIRLCVVATSIDRAVLLITFLSTLLFDLDPSVGLSRAHARAGKELRFEDMGLAFQEKAREGFLALAAEHDRFRIIDADGDPETVATRVWAKVAPHL